VRAQTKAEAAAPVQAQAAAPQLEREREQLSRQLGPGGHTRQVTVDSAFQHHESLQFKQPTLPE